VSSGGGRDWATSAQEVERSAVGEPGWDDGRLWRWL
jgi:hypothetical protein